MTNLEKLLEELDRLAERKDIDTRHMHPAYLRILLTLIKRQREALEVASSSLRCKDTDGECCYYTGSVGDANRDFVNCESHAQVRQALNLTLEDLEAEQKEKALNIERLHFQYLEQFQEAQDELLVRRLVARVYSHFEKKHPVCYELQTSTSEDHSYYLVTVCGVSYDEFKKFIRVCHSMIPNDLRTDVMFSYRPDKGKIEL